MMKNKVLKTLEDLCNCELKKIDIWFRANKLTANISKASKFMLSSASKTSRHNDFQIKMGDANLERVKSIKYLGVMLDDQLSWDFHIQYLSKKLSSACGILGKIKYYVDVPTLITIYHALFKSRLQYAIICWGSANTTILQSLRTIQNRALRHISQATRYSKMDTVYLNYRILKLDNLYVFELVKFMHDYSKKCLPKSFENCFPVVSHQRTRAATRGDFSIPRCNKVIGQKSIRYQGPKMWNEMSVEIKSASKNIFKILLKNSIFSEL